MLVNLSFLVVAMPITNECQASCISTVASLVPRILVKWAILAPVAPVTVVIAFLLSF